MNNPFEQIETRLLSIESLLLQVNSNIQLKKAPIQDEDIILDIDQAAAYIKLSIPSIYRLTAAQNLPSIKQGKKLLFSKRDLTAWLMQGRRTTLSSIIKDSQRQEPIATQ